MRELMVQLAPVLLGGTSEPLPPHKGTTITIAEIGSGSALPALEPIRDIIENLPIK